MAKKKGGRSNVPAKREKKKTEVKAVPISDGEAAILSLQEIGISEFKDPSTLSPSELENRAAELIKNRNQNEAELSAVLFYISGKNIPLDHGYDPNEYYEQRLGISKHRANVLISVWNSLVAVGIDSFKRLAGCSWEKLKLLMPAIKEGKVNKRNIETWLKKCLIDGILISELEKEVKALIADKAREEMDDSLKNVSFKVPAFELKTVGLFENVAQTTLKTNERGQWYLKALLDFTANYCDEKDADFWKAKGLAVLREVAQRIAPVSCIFIPLKPGISAEQLGVAPAYKIYQGYGSTADGQKADLRFCVAASESEAKKFLRVDSVREFDLLLGPSFMPETPFIEIGSPDLDAFIAALPYKDVKDKIRDLTRQLDVSREAYTELKKKIQKDQKLKGEALNRALLKCLLEKKGS